MANKKTTVTKATLEQALYSAAVDKALRARAGSLLPRTRALAYSHNLPTLARALDIETGIRPGGKASGGIRRPYARITAQMTTQMRRESARAHMSPKRLMRRAASA